MEIKVEENDNINFAEYFKETINRNRNNISQIDDLK